MSAADDVLTDANLVNQTFLQIEDPNPNVAARALASWRAVSRVVRDATEDDARAKWYALLCNGYKQLLTANHCKLATALVADGRHPLVHVKMLYKAYPYVADGPARRARTSLRVHFIHDLMHQHGIASGALPSRMRGMPLSKWINAQWNALEPWQQAVYMACHPDETIENMGRWARGGICVWSP